MKFRERKILITFFLFLICDFTYAQFSNAIWCFGDSSGIDFNDLANPIPIVSWADSRGSCGSISDTSGVLLFYSSYDADVYTIGGPPFWGGEIFNAQNN